MAFREDISAITNFSNGGDQPSFPASTLICPDEFSWGWQSGNDYGENQHPSGSDQTPFGSFSTLGKIQGFEPESSSVCHAAGVCVSDTLPKLKKKSQGRRKIPIKKIENKQKRHVTFSKRRQGLFNKASELCTLCGANVAIITFSEAGKVFTFGHPSPDAVIHRYLHQGASIGGVDHDDWWDRSIEGLGLEDLESFAALLRQLKSNVEAKLMNLNRQEVDKKSSVRFVHNSGGYGGCTRPDDQSIASIIPASILRPR